MSRVIATVSEDDADAERIETLTGYLVRELREVDGVEVGRAPGGEAPEGSKAVDLVAVGGLIMTVLTSQAIPQLVETIRGWLDRGPSKGRTVRLEIDGDAIELGAATEAQQSALVQAFIDRHSEPAQAGHEPVDEDVDSADGRGLPPGP